MQGFKLVGQSSSTVIILYGACPSVYANSDRCPPTSVILFRDFALHIKADINLESYKRYDAWSVFVLVTIGISTLESCKIQYNHDGAQMARKLFKFHQCQLRDISSNNAPIKVIPYLPPTWYR